MKYALPALLMLLAASPAHAEHPAFLPNRDVAVSYHLTAPGRPGADYDLLYDAADERARIEDPAQGTYFLIDLPAGTAQLVVPALHSIVDAPDLSALTAQIANAGGARFTLLGEGHYAGLACQKYLVLGDEGSGTACLTRDGVVLHFTGHDAHGSAEVTAVSVNYRPVAGDAMLPPSGFSAINLPPGALRQLLGQ